jgi:hypothetical protein
MNLDKKSIDILNKHYEPKEVGWLAVIITLLIAGVIAYGAFCFVVNQIDKAYLDGWDMGYKHATKERIK